MDRLRVFVIFSIVFGAASGALLNEDVREVNFKKLSNESNGYEFEYDLDDDGEKFHGETYPVLGGTYFFLSIENETYWTEISGNAYEEGDNFTQSVRKAERVDDKIKFEDDYARFSISFDGYITITPYQVYWNVKNICFTKADNQTFNFSISAWNTERDYKSTTYLVTDDPKVQRLKIDRLKWGGSSPIGVFEMYFTDDELLSDEEFCRGADKPIKRELFGILFL
ncbi:uncharacterized protein LOC119081269 [Bradysia coprophila]|uniref:uncharacterized protein LOC119081269 n=1 Tax=Bradysia coprophila TaxID=38358 RepID=UPI00187DA0B8|nr:uncharacterized protein LOC119081269 [Bradysia coprophila]